VSAAPAASGTTRRRHMFAARPVHPARGSPSATGEDRRRQSTLFPQRGPPLGSSHGWGRGTRSWRAAEHYGSWTLVARIGLRDATLHGEVASSSASASCLT